jgi:hypothetical protein
MAGRKSKPVPPPTMARSVYFDRLLESLTQPLVQYKRRMIASAYKRAVALLAGQLE